MLQHEPLTVCDMLQITKTEFVPKATTVVACCCVILAAASLSDRLLTMRTLASTGYLDALVSKYAALARIIIIRLYIVLSIA